MTVSAITTIWLLFGLLIPLCLGTPLTDASAADRSTEDDTSSLSALNNDPGYSKLHLPYSHMKNVQVVDTADLLTVLTPADDISLLMRESLWHQSEADRNNKALIDLRTRYFYIRSRLNITNVLTIIGPGSEIVMTEVGSTQEVLNRQLWYQDRNGILRSKTYGFALSEASSSNQIVKAQQFDEADAFKGTKASQLWTIQGYFIVNTNYGGKLNIRKSDKSHGALVILYDHDDDSINEMWCFQVPSHNPEKRTYFTIRSRLNMLHLLTAAASEPGSRVTPEVEGHTPEVVDRQLWYRDHCGFIRSKPTGYALDLALDLAPLTPNNYVVVNPSDLANENQQWVIEGQRIINRHRNEYIDIAHAQSHSGARVSCWSKQNGDARQNWMFEVFYEEE